MHFARPIFCSAVPPFAHCSHSRRPSRSASQVAPVPPSAFLASLIAALSHSHFALPRWLCGAIWRSRRPGERFARGSPQPSQQRRANSRFDDSDSNESFRFAAFSFSFSFAFARGAVACFTSNFAVICAVIPQLFRSYYGLMSRVLLSLCFIRHFPRAFSQSRRLRLLLTVPIHILILVSSSPPVILSSDSDADVRVDTPRSSLECALAAAAAARTHRPFD